jgi:hypothetical protein
MFEPRNKVWVGKRRQGKTLAMVNALKEPMRRGTPVYSNLRIRFTFKDRCVFSFFCPDGESFMRAMKTKKKCIFACDEIGLVFPAQYWTRMDMSLLSLFKQSGHIGVAFWGTTHNLSDIVGKLRYLVDDLYLCYKRNFFGFSRIPYVKNWKAFFKFDWFGHMKELPNGTRYKINNCFGTTPAYVFRVMQMKPSYKGTGGAREFQNHLIRSKIMYPSEYLDAMRAYDTQQWIHSDVMVKGNQAVSRKYSRVARTTSRLTKEETLTEKPKGLQKTDPVYVGMKEGHLDRLLKTYSDAVKN